MTDAIDLTTELTEVVQLAVRLEHVDQVIERALDAIGGAIPPMSSRPCSS